MKKNVRQDRILEILASNGEASVDTLVATLGVSVMTIRRDLAHLSREGRLSRTHGGAVLSRTGIIEFGFREKTQLREREKQAIAVYVASIIEPGMAISLDTGTTTLEVAKAISGIDSLTILTTSLAIASVLQGIDNIELVLLGGSVRKNSPDLTGPVTEDNLKRFRTHVAVLGADAVTKAGSFTTDIRISRISRAMRENADKIVLVTDSSKFTETSFVKCCVLSDLDVLVTDDQCPPDARLWLDAADCDVVYVPTGKRK